MHGKKIVKIGDKDVLLWFNNYSKAELAKLILPEDNGFPAKPEEFPLLEAFNRMVKENYLDLMRDIVWTGILGACFVKNTIPEVTKTDVSEYLAVCSNLQIQDIFRDCLDAMGVNVDHLKDTYTEPTEEDEGELKKKA